MKYRLRKDIKSAVNPKNIYGEQGDIVTLVSDRGNVLIVEGKDFTRFPVGKFDVEEIESN